MMPWAMKDAALHEAVDEGRMVMGAMRAKGGYFFARENEDYRFFADAPAQFARGGEIGEGDALRKI